MLLFNKALQLSSKSNFILKEEIENEAALRALHYSAQIFEILNLISQHYDKGYFLFLASLCYDIAGYQANAYCLSKELYLIEDETDLLLVKCENQFLYVIQLYLQKKLSLLNQHLPIIIKQLNTAEIEWDYKTAFLNFFIGMHNLVNYTLYGKEAIIENYWRESTLGFLECGNILLSRLNSLFEIRYKLQKRQCIWDVLKNCGKLPNPIWERFIKILTHDIYSGNTLKSPEDRISIFEFWRSQLKAIHEGIIQKNPESFIIQMPTSAGKTFVAELSILDALIEQPGCRCIYIAPFKALISEVENTWLCPSFLLTFYTLPAIIRLGRDFI